MNSPTNKRILVTGAGGFIGSHLVETLIERQAIVTALVRYTSNGKAGWLEFLPQSIKKRVKIVYGDSRDVDICLAAVAKNEYIFHLAAQIAIPYSYLAPRDFLIVNSLGTANILQAARLWRAKKFLHVSTSEVYGTAQYIPIDEKHPQVAQSPYAASKIAADKMVESFHLSFGLPTVIVRPFNCYGPRQSARAIIPTITLQALKGNIIKLGNIETRRDMNYVDDIIEGMISACFHKGTDGKTFNLASGKDYSVEEMVSLVADILGKKLDIRRDGRRIRPVKSEVQRLCGNSQWAAKSIGYKGKCRFKDGLKKTIRFYEDNIALYKKEDYQR
ncbi:MAG: GDP-mannose 4,6-dehydratase [candidate division Zixibacteria bacterium]|nr:GDP-mannose 4,6-dehydratase [candidate division Zixibacteria bacterium]